MAPRRPPDILRKSHAHSEGKERARARRELERALDESLAGRYRDKGLLIDLDGVVYRGDQPIEGAAATIAWLQDQGIAHLFVTNTTSRPRESIVARLSGFGIEVDPGSILAPPDAAAAWLQARGCRRLLLMIPEATQSAFEGFERVPEAVAATATVDAVVVGDLGTGWTFDRLNVAFRCLMQQPQPRLIALGMTRYWHAPDGLRLDTAPFVVALAHASGAEPTVLGKPAKAFFEAALARLGVPAGDAAMIGDDIRADVAGAQAAGLTGILVRTGKFRESDLALDITPDLILDSIASLPWVLSDGVSS